MSSSKKDGQGKKGRPKKLRSAVSLPGPWRSSSWVNSFGGKGASPIKFQAVSPSFVLRQLLVFVEKGKFVDASQLLNKITIDALKDIILDIPIEVIIESIPQSLVVLESLYSRLFISDTDNFPVEQFQVEVMVFHIVRYLSMLESSMEYKYPKPDDAKKSILNILRIVLHVNPDLVRTLYKRKKIMDTALLGIGQHGLIEINGSLISLHDALKLEIGRNITAYKGAVNTLEHLSLSGSKHMSLKIGGDKKSSQGQNHQALAKLNENQIKNRLFKNKALLNAIESRVNSHLPALIKTLKDRIEFDKSALLAFGKLKLEIKTFSSQTKVVPLLAQYAKSLQTVMDMFKDLLDEHCASDKSSYSTLGYHSDEEDMLSVQGAAEDISQETVVQPGTEAVEQKPAPIDPIEQILGPADADRHEKMSLPGEETPEKRSRWWKHHRRTQSLDMGSSRGRWRSNSSEPASPQLRSSSIDRSTISRPRRESVEESQEFQQMLMRIRDMSASSPAVGRRQLERRGISQPRSRDSSISPAALRRHFFGGGEQTPSISSQTDEVKEDNPDPLYASIKPKGKAPPKSSNGNAAKDDASKSQYEEVLKDRDRLAEREKKLMRENEQLKETLRMVTMELEKIKEGRKDSLEDEVFLRSPVSDEPSVVVEQALLNEGLSSEHQEVLKASSVEEAAVSEAVIIIEKTPVSSPATSSPRSPSVLASPSASDQENSSPELGKKSAASSFVEQQKAVLKERAESQSRTTTKTHHQPTEELPEASVKQRRASFERQLMASQQETSPVQVIKQPAKLKKSEQPSTPQQEESPNQSQEAPVQQKSSADLSPSSGDSETKEEQVIVVDPKESPVQDDSPTNKEALSPPSENQTPSSQKQLSSEIEPTDPLPKQESPGPEQRPSKESQMAVQPKRQTAQPKPSSKKAKSATFSTQLHLASIPESSSPAVQPKSASVVKQRPRESSPQRILSSSSNRQHKRSEEKPTHTNRHLPKNHIRHIMGDLLYNYDKLYSEQRAVAWTGLTIPPEDKDLTLFSVIVFAFQSAQTTIHELHMAKARMLQIPGTDDEESVSSYTLDIPPDNRSQVELLEHLRKMGDTFDLTPMIADVMEQLLDVSEHRKLLQSSAPLKKFVMSCVSLAWKLSIQSSPYIIDFELRSFDPAVHQRAPSSNRKSIRVKEHIWPALLDSTRGTCIYKGVVLT